MPRQYQPLEIKSFSKGLITEASPLQFPQDASIDEVNFEINNDKSRKRRLGLDLENGYQWQPTSGNIGTTSFNSLLWKNAGGDVSNSILVVQVGRQVFFYRTDLASLSGASLGVFEIPNSTDTLIFDMAIVDSFLVVAAGTADFHIFEYNNGSVSRRTERLLIRDTFGLEDTMYGVNLREGVGLTKRPDTLTGNHLYNLRNQTWALPRLNYQENSLDPIRIFNADVGGFPSNADSVFDAYYEDVSSDNPQMKKYFAEDTKSGPLGNFTAPKGFFVIDALNRGASRVDVYNQLMSDNPELTYSIGSLNNDRTEGGASCVAQYGGRIWFGGFRGEVDQPDDYSPDMSSYLLYSRLVQGRSDINKCYQESDPAGYEAPDLLDTDGGFIRVDGAYDIKRMFDVGKGLIIISSNGVWMVTGGSDYGFSATNNKVSKISERGCTNSSSCVLVDNSVIYWGGDGIYHVRPNQYGDYESINITEGTIQSFYDNIPSVSRLYCQGRYDAYDRKVRWVYNNTFTEEGNTEELTLDIGAGAFVRASFATSTSTPLKVVAPVEVPPYSLTSSQQNVTYNTEAVVYNGENVTVKQDSLVSTTRELKYIAARVFNSELQITFCESSNDSFLDWVSYDGVGVDAEAYMITGWVSGGDNMRMKQTPYLIMHMRRTETGFFEGQDGGVYPLNPSSCLVRSQWDWTDSPASGKWGRQFQAYRYQRPYIATGLQDDYDTGDRLIVTKNKLRGRGRVVSLDIRTEPGKDCHIYGWGMIVGVNNNV